MKQPYKKIATAVAFSPRLEANLAEAVRLASAFDAQLILIHVGEKNDSKKAQLKALLDKYLPGEDRAELVWKEGKPVEVILDISQEKGVDLLIAGALQKESLKEFYVGSIARKLCRKSKCSLLMLTNPKTKGSLFDHIVVNGHEHEDTRNSIHHAMYLAERTGSRQITVVDELDKDDAVAVEDDKTLEKSIKFRQQASKKEKERLDKIIGEYPLNENIRVERRYVFGKSGYSISHFAQSVRADLLVVNPPEKTLGFLDRFFTHDIEYILSDMPCNLLIVRA